MKNNTLPRSAQRSAVLDTLRGLTVINMILYHAIWDMVFLFGMDLQWYRGTGAYIWQQCICCTFILLSGFCSAMSRHPLRRGLTVFGIGAVVTLVTALFMPEDIVIFGVLTLIGSCMLLMIPLKGLLMRLPAVPALLVSLGLFLLTRGINARYLGFYGIEFLRLPPLFYQNYVTAYFGFPQSSFYSTDYFSLFPWFFLFLTGFFLHRLFGKIICGMKWEGIAPLNFIGRHALVIYVLHQPVIYGLCLLCSAVLP
jgi:uncharacterized membrane protein